MLPQEAASILGVDLRSNNLEEEAKKNYRRLVRETHPDKTKNQDADRFNQVQEAHEVIKDYLKNPHQMIHPDIVRFCEFYQVDPLDPNLESIVRDKFQQLEHQWHPVRNNNNGLLEKYGQILQATCTILEYVKNPEAFRYEPVQVNAGFSGPHVHHGPGGTIHISF